MALDSNTTVVRKGVRATGAVERNPLGPGEMLLWTTNFKPVTGGIAQFLHNLWNCVGASRPAAVVTPVPARGHVWDHSYRLQHLDRIPEGRAGRRPGDRFWLLRKVNTARYLLAMHRHARSLVATLPSGQRTVFIGDWNIASRAWCRELRKANIDYTLFVHGAEIVKPLPGPWPRWRREDFDGAHEIIAVSTGTAALVRSCFGQDLPVRIVRPGVAPPSDTDLLSVPRPTAARMLGGPGGRILLTVGRLVRRKGIDLVLRSVAGLVPDYQDITYIIAGDGPDRHRLEKLIAELGIRDRVWLMGPVDERTKWLLYRACEFFVMPNRLLSGTDWEGFGIVFLEAALAGRPAIGGNNGGVPDAIDHGLTGLLVDPENDRDLTSSLSRFLENPDLCRRMGEAGRQRARDEFRWEKVANRLCREYERDREEKPCL